MQLLVQQYNAIHQHFIVVLLLMIASCGLTVSLNVLIILLGISAGLIQTLFFLASGLDCFLIIVVLSGMEGSVYTTSMKTKQIAKKFGLWYRGGWSRRVIKSWKPLKIGFSIAQTVNLLMM